ncbi:hypothetical protein F207_062 [Campylobacter phage F207]|uniref:Uncharacterized protein n=1 Tax=Campylobacter phage F207 TaxID=2794360 RepID=A0A7T3KCS1_9CAUD|nr:hypothetical protein F207_062 [Campylobacter phage F207]
MKNILIVNFTESIKKEFELKDMDCLDVGDLFERKSIVLPKKNHESVHIDDVLFLFYEHDLLENVFELCYKNNTDKKYYFMGENNEITKFIQFFFREDKVPYYIIDEDERKMITQSMLDCTLQQIRENRQVKDFCIKNFETLRTRMKTKNDFKSEFSINGKFYFNIKISFLKNYGTIDITIDFKTNKNEDVLKNTTDFHLNDQGNYRFLSILGEDVSDRFVSDINNDEFSESLFQFLFSSMI